MARHGGSRWGELGTVLLVVRQLRAVAVACPVLARFPWQSPGGFLRNQAIAADLPSAFPLMGPSDAAASLPLAVALQDL